MNVGKEARICTATGYLLSFLLGLPMGLHGAEKAKPLPFEQFCKGRNNLAGRKNGLLLQATINVEKVKGGANARIVWTLDYNGPRPPLTILQPTVSAATSRQTEVTFFAEGKHGRVYEYSIASPVPPNILPIGKGLFLIQQKGKPLTGVIEIPITKIREGYIKAWPSVFGKNPPKIQVQLCHKPRERGVEHNMDAWTGEVWTQMLEVRLKNW
jgi:hypothetical protein